MSKRNVYKGHRYVPKIMGEWNQEETYEGLSIVTNKGTSFTSKKRVPVGIDILDEEYWVVTGNYNAQVEEYRENVRNIEEQFDSKSDKIFVDYEIERLNQKDENIVKQLDQTVQLITPNMTREEIQNKLNHGGDFKFTKGEYLIDLPNDYENEVFKLKSNTRVMFDSGAIVRLTAHNVLRYQIFSVENIENIVLENLNLDGSRHLNTSNGGEWGMGISIRGSKNVLVNNATIKNCWGDGIYIGRTTAQPFSENISVNDLFCDNNRRQGVSVISVKRLYGKNLKLINTHGTAPAAGIDFEPNYEDEVLEDIVIDRLTTYNNEGTGAIFAPNNFGKTKKNIDITINDFNSTNDLRGIYFLKFNGYSNGEVLFRNPIIRKSRSGAIGVRSVSKNFSKIIIDSPTIIDSNFKGEAGSTVESSGISIYRASQDFITDTDFRMGNIHIINPKFIRDEVANFPFIAVNNFINTADSIFDDIIIDEVDVGDTRPIRNEGLLLNFNRLNATNSITIKNERPAGYFPGTSPAVLNVWEYSNVMYSTINIDADKNVNIQLPKIASEHCMDLEILVTATGNYIQRILPPDGETIYPTSLLVDGAIETSFTGSKNEGSRITLRRRNNKWYVIDKIGEW